MFGPLFFLIYVNDIHNVVFQSTTKHFADDVAKYITFKSTEDCTILKEDLSRISDWAEKW